jgi:endonuclease YncB( thermonuclease family)
MGRVYISLNDNYLKIGVTSLRYDTETKYLKKTSNVLDCKKSYVTRTSKKTFRGAWMQVKIWTLKLWVLIGLVTLMSTGFAAGESFTGKVVNVTDGDTVVVLRAGNIQEKIRLAEIDCPEKSQAFGQRAKQFTLDKAAQKNVTIEVRDHDRYGRTVGEVFLPDGKSLNRELVRNGYAWWYRQYSKDLSLGENEQEARSARRGLWSDPNPIPPWDFRRKAKK